MLRSLSKLMPAARSPGRYSSVILKRTAATTKGGDGVEKDEEFQTLEEQKAVEFFQSSDDLQQQFLRGQNKEKQQQKSSPYKRDAMPPDLHAFLSQGNQIVETTISLPVSRRPRLPRYLRNDDDTEDQEEEDNLVSEKMPLMDKVSGFDTVRTTNFSKRQDRITSRIYQAAEVLDIHDLLRRKYITNPSNSMDKNFRTAMSEEEIAEQVYQEYGETNTLPGEEFQKLHKELLTNTLKYLEMPVLMKDTVEGDGFVGVFPGTVEELLVFRPQMRLVPKAVAKWVIEDLSDMRTSTSK